jgi:hypothetical protein
MRVGPPLRGGTTSIGGPWSYFNDDLDRPRSVPRSAICKITRRLSSNLNQTSIGLDRDFDRLFIRRQKTHLDRTSIGNSMEQSMPQGPKERMKGRYVQMTGAAIIAIGRLTTDPLIARFIYEAAERIARQQGADFITGQHVRDGRTEVRRHPAHP